MSLLQPADPQVLATAVVDNLVIASDPDAPASGVYYWEISRPWRDAVVAAVRASADDTIRTLGEAVLEAPADPRHYAALQPVDRLMVDPLLRHTAGVGDTGRRAPQPFAPF